MSERPRSDAQGERRDEKRGFRKTREGLVVSDKMEKTVVVAVEDRVKHPLYGKVLRRTSKLQGSRRSEQRCDRRPGAAHGDPPLSATKRWRVVEILEKAK